jgi:uncharacterized delta-60 repeat protein
LGCGLAAVLLCTWLAGCGGGGGSNDASPPPAAASHAVSVQVSGLEAPGEVLVSLSHPTGYEEVALPAGRHTFASPVAEGASFRVNILGQPQGSPPQNCAMAGSGLQQLMTMPTGGAADIRVDCQRRYIVGGTVTGLRGAGLALHLEGIPPSNGVQPPVSEQLSIAVSGAFSFVTALENRTAFIVSVVTQPQGPTQVCSIINAPLGSILDQDYTGVAVTCVDDVPEYPKRRWRMQTGHEAQDIDPQPGFRVLAESAGFPAWSDEGGGRHNAEAGYLVSFLPPLFGMDDDQIANTEVYSGNLGRTYWVSAEAPHRASSRLWHPDGSNDATSHYWQRQSYRKSSLSRLQLQVTDLALVGYDFDADGSSTGGRDGDLIIAQAVLYASVMTGAEGSAQATVKERQELQIILSGRHDNWEVRQYLDAESTGRVLSQELGEDSLHFNDNVVGSGFPAEGQGHGYGAEVYLLKPITLELDLSGIADGEEFTVEVQAAASAHDPSDWEGTFASAYLRDPVRATDVGHSAVSPGHVRAMRAHAAGESSPDALGFSLVPTSLEATNRPFLGEPESPAPGPVVCSAADAGTVQFDASAYRTTEGAAYNVQSIFLTRTGGSSGELEVTVETSGGSAAVNGDYRPLSQRVRWGDGDTLPRLIEIRLIPDADVEDDETIGLRLVNPACGGLGEAAATTLTVVNDDVETPIYSVGGTVSGLTGTGLVIREGLNEIAVTANGPFVFPADRHDGWEYDVQVEMQPQGPRQICTVSNGAGIIAGANVTNVAIVCADAPTPGSLDASFGSGGISTGSFPAGAEEMAVLSDGRILVANHNWRLARYSRDGAADATFGAGGEATVTFTTHGFDELHGIAVQPDGKIVVAGFSRPVITADNDDFAVARLNADGSLDTTFGTGGKVTTDFFGSFDRAHFVLIQPDGRIVVGGEVSTSATNSDLALVRYLTDGSLDASFGTAGKVLTDLSARDAAYAAALRPDGRILIGGGYGVSAIADLHADSVLAQYLPDGALDGAFAVGGIRGLDLSAAGLPGSASDWIEALALQADGRIVTTDGNGFRAARFTADGALDAGFGTGAFASVDFNGQTALVRAIALQQDGRILLAGWVRDGVSFRTDFAIARLDANGLLDTGFATDGRLLVDFFGADDGAYAIAPQDGRMVVAGLAISSSTRLAALLRLLL